MLKAIGKARAGGIFSDAERAQLRMADVKHDQDTDRYYLLISPFGSYRYHQPFYSCQALAQLGNFTFLGGCFT